MTVTVLSTAWVGEIDAQELLDLADLAESHGLLDEAAQLRQAAEDVEIHTEYVNDLARLIESDGNPFAGITQEAEWPVTFSRVLHASAAGTADATMSLEVQADYHSVNVAQTIDGDVTMTATVDATFATTRVYAYHHH